MKQVFFRRKRSVFQRNKPFYGRAIRIFSRSVLQPVKHSPERPHSLMEMRIQVTMENSVSDHSCQTAGAVQDIKGITLLGTDRNRIHDRRFRIIGIKQPLVIVKMKNMGFFYSAVNQPYFRRISNIGS